jgi:hypothetical protein
MLALVGEKQWVGLMFLLAFFFVVLCYLPGLGEVYFPVDDYELLTAPQVASGFSADSFLSVFKPGNHIDYYPIRDLSYKLDFLILGSKNFTGMRLENFLIWFFSMYFLFKTLVLLKLPNQSTLFVVLIWSIAPSHSELLMWISSRKDLLAIFFTIIAVFFYIKKFHLSQNRYLVLSVLFFALGLLSKASFSLLPIVGLFFVKKQRSFFELLPFLVLGFFSSLLQSYQYSEISDMRFFYEWDYRWVGSLAALGRTFLGIFYYPLNIVDLENWGTWAWRNQAFAYIGALLWIVLLVGIGKSFFKKKYLVFKILIAGFVLYLPVSALGFSHRNFYSVRYMEPVFLLFPIGLALFLNQKTLSKLIPKRFVLVLLAAAGGTFLESSNWAENIAVFRKATVKASGNNVAGYGILLKELAKESAQVSRAAEIKEEIQKIQQHLSHSCALSGDQMNRNGSDCWSFYADRMHESLIRSNTKEFWIYYDLIQKSLISVNPRGADRVGLVLKLEAAKVGIIDQAEFRHMLVNFVNLERSLFKYLPRENLRYFYLVGSCLIDGHEQARKRFKKFIDHSLLTKSSYAEFVAGFTDIQMRKQVQQCLEVSWK